MLAELLCAAVVAIGMPGADRACEHMELVVEVSEQRDIKPEILVALIHVESRWKPAAKSSANACGLTQVIPKWTGGRATSGIKYTCEQLFVPTRSIRVGAEIFSWWLHHYGRCRTGRCRTRHYTTGLCGYNAGFRCKGENANRTGMSYSRAVQRMARRIERAAQEIRRSDDS